MKGEQEKDEFTARLNALILQELLQGDLSDNVLRVSQPEIDALDPERIQRIKKLVASEDLAGLRAVAQPELQYGGLNRGDESDTTDESLEEARKRVQQRLRKEAEEDHDQGESQP
jgi:hypothetical protein